MKIATEGDRRSSPRVRVAGSATVHVNAWCCHSYRLVDLSASGALLDGPHVRPGRRVRLAIAVDGAEPLWLDGRVARAEEGDRRLVAIEFVDLEPAAEDALQDLALAALSGERLRPLPADLAVEWVPLPSESPPDEPGAWAEAN